MADSPGPHVIPSAGFLDGSPQHRTFWTIGTAYSASLGSRPSGDILVTDGEDFYEVRGFPVKRHSYFDPRLSGYRLFAGALAGTGDSRTTGSRRRAKAAGNPPVGKWASDIPLTGKAMVLADDVVFVAGTPVQFPPDDQVAKYEAAYGGKLGGVLWAASAADGKKLAEYRLDAAPAWDGMAAAYGKLFLSLNNGSVVCLGEETKGASEAPTLQAAALPSSKPSGRCSPCRCSYGSKPVARQHPKLETGPAERGDWHEAETCRNRTSGA